LGVDRSARQIARARRNAPLAEFIHADITAIDFPDSIFRRCDRFSFDHQYAPV
jgi:hypothetical protein